MPALSTKDKLKLRLSAARMERWNRERLKPADNDVDRCKGIVFAPGQDKPEEVIQPDGLDSVHRLTDGHKMRLSAGKLTLVRRGDNFSDYHDADYSESPRDPVWKEGQSKIARSRPDSPFKRAGRATSSVVIVRK